MKPKPSTLRTLVALAATFAILAFLAPTAGATLATVVFGLGALQEYGQQRAAAASAATVQALRAPLLRAMESAAISPNEARQAEDQPEKPRGTWTGTGYL